jgi:hypothetical protein
VGKHWALVRPRRPQDFGNGNRAIAWSFVSNEREFFDISLVERKAQGEYTRYALYKGAIRDGRLKGRRLGWWEEGCVYSEAFEGYASYVLDVVYYRDSRTGAYLIRRNHTLAETDISIDAIVSAQQIPKAADAVRKAEEALSRKRAALNEAIHNALSLGTSVAQIAIKSRQSRQWIYALKANPLHHASTAPLVTPTFDKSSVGNEEIDKPDSNQADQTKWFVDHEEVYPEELLEIEDVEIVAENEFESANATAEEFEWGDDDEGNRDDFDMSFGDWFGPNPR